MKPKIKKVVKKITDGEIYISYQYNGKKYNTKSEIIRDIQEGRFGRRLSKVYK